LLLLLVLVQRYAGVPPDCIPLLLLLPLLAPAAAERCAAAAVPRPSTLQAKQLLRDASLTSRTGRCAARSINTV
jgi:hypothetical protein